MNRIKELRKQKGKTLDQMQDETGIKRGTLNNYENGKTEPKLETWQKLADYFDVPVGYLQGLGVSKKEVVRDLVNELFFEKPRKIALFTKDILTEKNSYFASNLSEFTFKPNEYVNCTDYVQRAIDLKDEMFLDYSIQKFVSLVTNYHFLSRLNKDNMEGYYNDLSIELELQATKDLTSWQWVEYKVNKMSLDSDSKEELVDILSTLLEKTEELQTRIDYLENPDSAWGDDLD